MAEVVETHKCHTIGCDRIIPVFFTRCHMTCGDLGRHQENNLYWHDRMQIWIDTTPRKFHQYTINWDGTVIGKKGDALKPVKRYRRGGGYDLCVRLAYNRKVVKWTLGRLIASCFMGNIDGLQINHDDRDPTNCAGWNLDIMTGSDNQKHWRRDK